MASLVLASSSPYRAQLLKKLGLPFIQASPDIDESPLMGEPPEELVVRLATEKAQALASQHPNHLIIGSDQVACFNGQILGKPGGHQRAKEQLSAFSGHKVEFCTGLCVFNSQSKKTQTSLVRYWVHFRTLQDAQIDTYLKKEQPYDCAGSFKSEGLGIALFAAMEGDDPNSLIGLPLIELNTLLLNEQVDALSQ